MIMIIYKMAQTFNSNAPTAKPDAAPEPASPIKCSDPILDAKSDAPTSNQFIPRPAKKYESIVFRLCPYKL